MEGLPASLAPYYIHTESPCTPAEPSTHHHHPRRRRPKWEKDHAVFTSSVLQAAGGKASPARLMVPVPPKHGRWKYMFMQLSDPIPSSERRKEGLGAEEAHTVLTCQQLLHFIIY